MSTRGARKSGRRPGASGSRDAIAAAARAQFAEVGYERATIRAIARAAAVDPALVLHFYGSKEELFTEVMDLPAAVADAIAALADGSRESVGRRLAEVVVAVLENPATRMILLGRIRSASSHPAAADLVRQTVTRDLGRLASVLAEDEPELRTALVGTHLVGLAIARYVVLVEPLASMPPADLVDVIAPVVQRYLTEPLTAEAGS